MPYTKEIFRTHFERISLSVSLSLSLISFFLFLSYSYDTNKQKNGLLNSFTSRIKKHTERDACAYRSSVLVFLHRGEKRERERKRG